MKKQSRASVILRNTLSNYMQYVVKVGISLISIPIIIRLMGKELYGLWELVMSMIGFIGLLDFGFATSVVKYVAESKGQKDSKRMNLIVSTVFYAYLFLAAAVVILSSGFAFLYSDLFHLPDTVTDVAPWVMILIGIRTALNFPFSVYRGVLFGHQRIALLNAIEIVMNILEATASILVLYLGFGIIGFACAYLASYLLKALTRMYFSYRETENLHVSVKLFQKDKLREVTSVSLYLFIILASGTIAAQVDRIVIKLFAALEAVAVYSVAAKMSNYVFRLAKQFINALTPLIAELKGAGETKNIQRVMLEGTKLSLIIVSPLAMSLFFFSKDLMVAWIGPDFEESGVVLSILLLAIFPTVIQANAGNILAMTDNHRFAAWTSLGSAILNVIMSVILIQFLGLPGVALGTLISAFVMQTILVLYTCRVIPIDITKLLIRSILPIIPPMIPAFLIMFIIRVYIHPTNLILVGIESGIGAAVYLIFAYFLSFDQKEKNLYRGKVLKFIKRKK
ncbi:MAG: hypothetical protein B6244_03500 [Candidatus Cloacimonetes bacterium 4572_55]|nr:MAG: hypothetical protein B6244_03500 [Candidatus Cloacimonetes bacterium 4572_55]